MFKKNAFAILLAGTLLASCGPVESTTDTVLVSFSVGDEIVYTEDLGAEGGIPENYAYEPEAGELVGWYLTPSYSRIYDFKEPLTEDTTLFGAISVYQEDTRDFYIAGSGSSPTLTTSSWGDTPNEDHLFSKADGENVYTITCDLYEGDQFQIVSFLQTETDPYFWDWQYGAGYVANTKDLAGIIEGGGGLAASNRKSNINILKDGNYTLTLRTYPDHIDPEDEEHICNLDNLTITRNGEISEPRPESTLDYYIKGEHITDWANMLNAATRLTADGDDYKLSIFLREGEQFMFHTIRTNTATGETSDGGIYINYNNLDEASQALFTHPENGTNILANADGMYTFTYTTATEVLKATVDTTATLQVGDYYINGTIASDEAGAWTTSTVHTNDALMDTYKLSVTEDPDIYAIEGVEFRANDQFTIAAFTAGSTTVGEGWANQFGSYNFTYSAPGNSADAWQEVGGGNANFLCKEAGTYDISFDVYSKIVTIAASSVA